MRIVIAFILALLSGAASADLKTVSDAPSVTVYSNDLLNRTVFRLGVPVIARGPTQDFGDEPITFVPKANGFYVYGSNQAGWAATSRTMTSGYSGSGGYAPCKGTTLTVQGTGDTLCSSLTLAFKPGSLKAVTGHNNDECGDWVNSSYHNPYDGLWYLLVHNEGPCLYHTDVGSTDESMSMWTSKTGAPGTWVPMAVPQLSSGTVVSSDEAYELKWMVGPGDCTMIPDAVKAPRFMYMICGFYSDNPTSDYKNLIARAPIRSMGPGNWKFYRNGCYCAPALNNHYDATAQRPQADMFAWVGAYASAQPGTSFALMTLAWGHIIQPVNDPKTDGERVVGFTLAVSASLEHPNFEIMKTPILNYDEQIFTGRPVVSDGYFYQIFRNDVNGGSVVDPRHYNLWYVWVPPNNGLEARYIVQQPVRARQVSPDQIRSGYPQVGVALETWANGSKKKPYSGFRRTTTVNPLAGITSSKATELDWSPARFLGYILTACPGSATVNKCDSAGAAHANQIEECWNGGSDDYQLHIDTNGKAGSCPAGWTHVRTAGWLYKSAPLIVPSRPIYACFNAARKYHFSSNLRSCEEGEALGLLGYAAAQ